MLAKFNVGYKLKDFMYRGRKGKSYVIPVWSDKTVLEMGFVESTSFKYGPCKWRSGSNL